MKKFSAVGGLRTELLVVQEARHVVDEYLAKNPIGSRVEYYVYRLRDALAEYHDYHVKKYRDEKRCGET